MLRPSARLRHRVMSVPRVDRVMPVARQVATLAFVDGRTPRLILHCASWEAMDVPVRELSARHAAGSWVRGTADGLPVGGDSGTDGVPGRVGREPGGSVPGSEPCGV